MFSFFNNKGVLGINARNLLYLKPYNPKKAVKLADDKIKTKQFLSTRNIPVPKLYGVIKDTKELEKFDFNSLPSSFALKPNTGYGGEGIIPVIDVKDGYFYTAGGQKFSKNELKDHIQDILDGRFSISNVSDFAFFEQYIVADERVGKFSFEGLPDIRVIVHNLIPVMAMLRLPTRESKGKANLHMGAVGVGIDIAKGQTTYISYKNRIIDELPDGIGAIKGLKIPFWDKILNIASTVQLITNLGYMAIDICLDKNTGPVLLEINARAGLGVQIANLAPLRKRLERIEGVKVSTPAKGVRIAKDMFGNIVEKEIAHLSGKQVVSTMENVEIIQKHGTLRVNAKIDTTKKISTLDEETALKSGLLENSDDYDDEKSSLKMKFTLKNKRIHTVVELEKISSPEYKMILGTRDLKDFLIDTNTNLENINNNVKIEKPKRLLSKKYINFYELDQQLLQIDNKLKLLYHLRPINFESEKDKFFKTKGYNPQFEYPQLKFDPLELLDQIEKITTDESILGQIFQAKKNEIINKIHLLDAIDEESFSGFSIQLYGRPSLEDRDLCEKYILETSTDNLSEEPASISADQAKEKFENTFKQYGLQNKWKVKIKQSLVSNCVAGKNNRLFLKSDAKFSNSRIEELIVHEIETHILTAENGKNQPYEIFNRGLGNYLSSQEGLAMYNVEAQRKQYFLKNHKALGHVIAIYESLNHGFVKVFEKLVNLGINREQAFRSVLKAKRGIIDTSKKGTFTKDYIYFKGYFQVKNFVENGGDLKDLYIGKFDINDLEKIRKIPGIQKAKILPEWLKVI